MLRTKGGKAAAAAAAAQKDPIQAGEESYRVDRQTLTYPDKLLTTLIELCAGIGQYRQLFISDHFFAPREYLSQHIEHKFVDLILAMAYDSGSTTPRRPSDLLMIIHSYMTVLQNIDACELRCLAQIIGPYGVKYLAERLTWHVASQIGELNKRLCFADNCTLQIVVANKEMLHTARTQFDCNERMKEVIQALSHEPKEKKAVGTSASDAILQRTSIIGQIFCFRNALHVALEQVLLNRLPFLMSSFTNLYCSMDDAGKSALGELGAAMGVQGPVDVALSNAIRAQNLQINPDEHYQMSCLLLVAIAISLPKLAVVETATYKPSLRASMNNTHCIPLAVNTIAGALFHHHGRGDTHLRMKEFLASIMLSKQHMSDHRSLRLLAVRNGLTDETLRRVLSGLYPCTLGEINQVNGTQFHIVTGVGAECSDPTQPEEEDAEFPCTKEMSAMKRNTHLFGGKKENSDFDRTVN
ncbi:hypothetical protein COOONC_20946 [Cooperia oncophora]